METQKYFLAAKTVRYYGHFRKENFAFSGMYQEKKVFFEE